MPEKLTYEYIKNFVNETGETLLSEDYKNTHTKILIKCKKCSNEYYMTFYNFRYNHRCPKCAIKYKADKNRFSYEYVKNFLEKEGYKLLSNEYSGGKEKILIKCGVPEHEPYYKRFSLFKNGARCAKCYNIRTGERTRLKYEDVKEYIESIDGYKLLSNVYKSRTHLLDFQCSKGHTFKMRFGNFKGGQRCPKCSSTKMYSNAEKEIYNYIKSLYTGKIIENDRSVILNRFTNRYLELDIWLPELNLAIEYNGLYWHKIKYQKIKDQIKLNECKNKGILLFIITDEEWQNNQNEIKNKIKGLINYLQTDIKLLP